MLQRRPLCARRLWQQAPEGIHHAELGQLEGHSMCKPCCMFTLPLSSAPLSSVPPHASLRLTVLPSFVPPLSYPCRHRPCCPTRLWVSLRPLVHTAPLIHTAIVHAAPHVSGTRHDHACRTGYRVGCYPLQLSGPTSSFISASDRVASFGHKVTYTVVTVPA